MKKRAGREDNTPRTLRDRQPAPRRSLRYVHEQQRGFAITKKGGRTVTTRQEAIDILERGHGTIRRLTKEIPLHWMARPGVGGGIWTPKDLLGHLCFWEEKVLDALASWDSGERAPIDREIYTASIATINAEGVRNRSRHTLARVFREWENVHGELIRAMRTMPDARWENPATPRGRKSLGHRMGQLLVGRGPFEHADSHVRDLEVFVEAIPQAERSGTD